MTILLSHFYSWEVIENMLLRWSCAISVSIFVEHFVYTGSRSTSAVALIIKMYFKDFVIITLN